MSILTSEPPLWFSLPFTPVTRPVSYEYWEDTRWMQWITETSCSISVPLLTQRPCENCCWERARRDTCAAFLLLASGYFSTFCVQIVALFVSKGWDTSAFPFWSAFFFLFSFLMMEIFVVMEMRWDIKTEYSNAFKDSTGFRLPFKYTIFFCHYYVTHHF